VLSVPPPEERRAFLSEYLARLEALDTPEAPAGRNFLRMSEEQREIWVTLFPTAASFLDTELDAQRSTEALSAAKRWAVQTLARAMATTA
jgi:truncated hemoglobin YjbI